MDSNSIDDENFPSSEVPPVTQSLMGGGINPSSKEKADSAPSENFPPIPSSSRVKVPDRLLEALHRNSSMDSSILRESMKRGNREGGTQIPAIHESISLKKSRRAFSLFKNAPILSDQSAASSSDMAEEGERRRGRERSSRASSARKVLLSSSKKHSLSHSRAAKPSGVLLRKKGFPFLRRFAIVEPSSPTDSSHPREGGGVMNESVSPRETERCLTVKLQEEGPLSLSHSPTAVTVHCSRDDQLIGNGLKENLSDSVKLPGRERVDGVAGEGALLDDKGVEERRERERESERGGERWGGESVPTAVTSIVIDMNDPSTPPHNPSSLNSPSMPSSVQTSAAASPQAEKKVSPSPVGWGRRWSFLSTRPMEWGRTCTSQTIHEASDVLEKNPTEESTDPFSPRVDRKWVLCILLLLLLLLAGGIAVGVLYAVGVFKWKDASSHAASIVYEGRGAPPAPGVPATSLCAGACCTSSAPVLYEGEGVMSSTWWSNDLFDNAQIQLFSVGLSQWVGSASYPSPWPASSPSALSAVLPTPPGPLEVFTVRRTPGNLLQFLAPNGLYMAVQSDGTVAASAMESGSDTAFQSIAVGSHQMYLLSPDLRFLTASKNASGSLRMELLEKPGKEQLFSIREAMGVPAFRGVNLGGWLVVEEWMSPELFTNVPLLIDGTTIQLQSLATKLWVTSAEAGRTQMSCSSTSPGSRETFHIRRPEGPEQPFFQLRTDSKMYWTRWGIRLYTYSLLPTAAQNRSEFVIFHSPYDDNIVMVSTVAGSFLRAHPNGRLLMDGTVTLADLGNGGAAAWSSDTAFRLVVTSEIGGEWQLAASLGPSASSVLTKHRSSFLSERDFQWLRSHGLNAVRVPVGYWIAQEQPDAPFVAGGLQALDSAMDWGEKHGVRVLLSMHAAAGSQNGYDHSASRDGLADMFDPSSNGTYIATTLNAISFLVQRYGERAAFAGIGVLNEPSSRAAPNLSALKSFFLRAYAAVRRHSKCAHVVIGPRIDVSSTEFDSFMTTPNFTNVIFDMHEYNTFDLNVFEGKNAAFNVDFVRTQRRQTLQSAEQGVRQVMVGEWSLALLPSTNATVEDIQNFAEAQLEVYGQASAGWFFWSYKLLRRDYPNWSFRQAVEAHWLRRSKGTSFW